MGIIYNIAFIIFAVCYIPIFILKKKKRQGIRLRLGLYPSKVIKELKRKKNIWVHAVSIGEVMAVSSLADSLRKKYPSYRLVITTVTESGNKMAKKLIKGDELVLFLPFDITFSIRRVLSYIKPAALIIAETEIWPNLIRNSYKDRIPVVIINGRISDTSFGRYRMIKFMLRPILKRIKLFLMQSVTDKERIVSLGADTSKVRITGNMKFDTVDSAILSDSDKEKLISELGLTKGDRLFIAGSTNPGEEEIILQAFAGLKKEFNNLRLLIAPRHTERASELEGLITEAGFMPIKLSNLSAIRYPLSAKHVVILDTIGQLKSLYSIADVVFVGGSLIKKGGQNILEPAVFAKPILFGPYMFNFRDITELFLKNQAAVMINDAGSLRDSIADILRNDNLRNSLCQRAKEVVQNNKGATGLTLKEIAALL